MMDPFSMIDKYYPDDNRLRQILVLHSVAVKNKALWIVDHHPELNADRNFVAEAAMLHDIGIFLTDAPSICCTGTEPYIRHGYLGAELMRKEGLPRHALVCERHTGAGLSLEEIERQQLPVPHKDMLPVSIEEQIICFADKFFSKTNLEQEKTVERACNSLLKYGDDGVVRFKKWCESFL
jgi:uncharacterized protein